MRRSAAVLSAAGLLLAAGIVLTLSKSDSRVGGSNLVPLVAFPDGVPAGGTICQRGETVPADTAALRVLAASFGKPMPAFDVQIRTAEGSVVQRGSLPGGSAEGKISIPLEHSVSEVPNATVCIRGHTTRTAFGGVATDAGGARVAGHPQHGIFRIEYMRAGRESWWSMFSEISRRFGYAKASVIGTWTLPALVVMALMLYALVGAVLWRFVVSR